MLCRNAVHIYQFRNASRIPPVELLDAGNACLSQKCPVAEVTEEQRVVGITQPPQRRDVGMIIMIVA
ncbi:MAG: hypothetical protein AMS22_12565 [Thiotrichales bacterium SG8_50]|nr:MAG: hypothetical protein AMS22_12565 [Thiotrichales bacterium SG8_50]